MQFPLEDIPPHQNNSSSIQVARACNLDAHSPPRCIDGFTQPNPPSLLAAVATFTRAYANAAYFQFPGVAGRPSSSPLADAELVGHVIVPCVCNMRIQFLRACRRTLYRSPIDEHHDPRKRAGESAVQLFCVGGEEGGRRAPSAMRLVARGGGRRGRRGCVLP